MAQFDFNDVGVVNGNFFALPYTLQESEIALLSVPWDTTVSYRDGAAQGPEAMVEASSQIDLFDEFIPNAWDVKIATIPVDSGLKEQNARYRKIASDVIEALSHGYSADTLADKVAEVNSGSGIMNGYVYSKTGELLAMGKKVGLIGGEHSVPLGYVKSLARKYSSFGILHIDAHADLRRAYEGFTYSHASIMYNILNEIPQVKQLTQVATRDFCSDEYGLFTTDPRIKAFTDSSLQQRRFNGENWNALCDEIIGTLPENVYVSFDIDGLSPEYCPNTGTPVPGGLTFREADYLLLKLKRSGRNIIGFDLCEVAPGNDEWDANVGARMLYKLCLYLN